MAHLPPKRPAPVPPLKGSFPLDKAGLCRKQLLSYLICMSEARGANESCREESKDYFQCRMSNNLMEKDDFERLGYSKEDRDIVDRQSNPSPDSSSSKSGDDKAGSEDVTLAQSAFSGAAVT